MAKYEFICEDELLVALIQKLTEATKEHKIFWYRDSSNSYRIRCRKEKEILTELAILFGVGQEETITMIVKELPKTFTPSDIAVWQSLKELEWAIQECLNSIEACITSMFKALSELRPY